MKIKQFAAEWMGKVATAPTRLVRQSVERKGTGWMWIWATKDEPITGWVTGVRTLSDGRTEYEGFDDDWCSFWVPSAFHRVALIVSCPNMKPVPVPLEALRHTDEAPTVPTQCPWTDKDRADARAAVVGHKRDARGRWVGGRKP